MANKESVVEDIMSGILSLASIIISHTIHPNLDRDLQLNIIPEGENSSKSRF